MRKRLGVVLLSEEGGPLVDARALENLAATIPERKVSVESVRADGDAVRRAIAVLSEGGVDELILLPMDDESEARGSAILKSMGGKKSGRWSRVKVEDRPLRIYLCSSVFRSGSIPAMAFDRISRALSSLDSTDATLEMGADEIYRKSFRKVRSLVRPYLSNRSRLERELIVRIVHAAADAELAGEVLFSKGALKSGLDAIASGSDILVDTEMVRAGLYSPALKRFGCKSKCYLRDERVEKLAAAKGITKTAAAVRVAAQEGIEGDVVVVGNAPTALIELVKMVEEGKARPSLVIGVPCGFVNAAESKESLAAAPVQFITVKGHKGGSAVAASVVNFLAGEAENRARGRRRA